MRRTGFTSLLAALLLPAMTASTAASPPTPRLDDIYEITLTTESVSQGENGSSGSSHDRDVIIEKTVGLRADGLALEYDLPPATSPAEQATNWQFPALVFRPSSGPAQLLNGPELEARLDGWLKAAKWSRAICGHWIFTWNAFLIECDPQSVIKTIAAFDLRSAYPHDGALYKDTDAQSPGTMIRKTTTPDGETFAVEMPADPDVVRHARAQADFVVAQIMNKPVTLDTALQAHSGDTVTGTISVVFETDSSGSVRRRTKVTKLQIKGADGRSETQTVTETLERRLMPRSN